MKRLDVSVPEIGFVAVTRALGGIGVGLLVAGCLGASLRRRVGWTLLAIGALTTIPIAVRVIASRASRHR